MYYSTIREYCLLCFLNLAFIISTGTLKAVWWLFGSYFIFIFQSALLLLNFCCVALLYCNNSIQQAPSSFSFPLGKKRFFCTIPNFLSSISTIEQIQTSKEPDVLSSPLGDRGSLNNRTNPNKQRTLRSKFPQRGTGGFTYLYPVSPNQSLP